MKQLLTFIIIAIITISCSTNQDDWYQIQQLNKRTYSISEPNSSQRNSSFLIIGEKEAILLDAGTGENKMQSMAQVANSLSPVPVTLLLSHFHFDHIGGASDFRKVGLAALPFLANRLSADSILVLTKTEVLSDDTISLKIDRLYPVGEAIDLGNRNIQVLHTPGHSKASIALIDHEQRYIFTGDLIYNDLLLVNNCEAYLQSINTIQEHSNAGYRIFGSHGTPEVDYAHLVKVKEALTAYLADDGSFDSIRNISFFGTPKEVYQKGDVAFIVGYSDVFKH
ncbi:MBL fold metallo-hydrolase [Carboxylicivirga mesophila]|uniref:MBL fold metallo-hydrolase n=1 Tax=Carboxylicivirga mesophila TaxID=1166478 RepID=A0ABS5K8P1_9BACT|nr:MBL fold metallo-hydrolase [Carboxylicivirga mesophila]MBS2210908.1 MBL fold metallo-hydrolase [Carboxylicivirga mesophila]